MDDDLVRQLELEYYGTLMANPWWDVSLARFLESRGVSRDDIWEQCPEAAADEGWDPPEWL